MVRWQRGGIISGGSGGGGGGMTKAAAGMVCGGEKKLFLRFLKILIFGEEAICPDGLFVPAVFRESNFNLNSLIYGLSHC